MCSTQPITTRRGNPTHSLKLERGYSNLGDMPFRDGAGSHPADASVANLSFWSGIDPEPNTGGGRTLDSIFRKVSTPFPCSLCVLLSLVGSGCCGASALGPCPCAGWEGPACGLQVSARRRRAGTTWGAGFSFVFDTSSCGCFTLVTSAVFTLSAHFRSCG